MAFNAGERKDIRRAEKDMKNAQVIADDVLRGILSTPMGRQWVWERLGPVFHNPYQADPHATAYNCGIQSAAQALLLDCVRVSPNDFILAMQESNERTMTNERRQQPANDPAAAERSVSEDAGRDDQGSVIDPADDDAELERRV